MTSYGALLAIARRSSLSEQFPTASASVHPRGVICRDRIITTRVVWRFDGVSAWYDNCRNPWRIKFIFGVSYIFQKYTVSSYMAA